MKSGLNVLRYKWKGNSHSLYNWALISWNSIPKQIHPFPLVVSIKSQKSMLPILEMYSFTMPREVLISDLVPLRFLHLLGLSLCCEDEAGSESGHCSLAYSLLRVPHRVEDVVKERLNLLKEESGCADGQFPQHQHLQKKRQQFNIRL